MISIEDRYYRIDAAPYVVFPDDKTIHTGWLAYRDPDQGAQRRHTDHRSTGQTPRPD